jgi:large subunit ribosomal protein L35
MPQKAFKPNKSIAKRFKVTKTGKLKRHHGFTSHLMSSRSANKRRKLRQGAIVSESHAQRLRKVMGIAGVGPGKAAAKARAARNAAKAAATETAASA